MTFFEKLLIIYETYFRHLNLLVNTTIFIDLYLVIKNPFVARESRMKWYWLFISLFTIFLWVLSEILNKSIEDQITGEEFDIVGVLFIASFVLVTIPAITVVIKRLLIKSTSRDLKIKILKRHILYFIFYLIFVAQTILMYLEIPL